VSADWGEPSRFTCDRDAIPASPDKPPVIDIDLL